MKNTPHCSNTQETHNLYKNWILLSVHALVVKLHIKSKIHDARKHIQHGSVDIKSNINIIYCLLSICSFYFSMTSLFIYFFHSPSHTKAEKKHHGIIHCGRMVYLMANIFCVLVRRYCYICNTCLWFSIF